ncbi:unnamed protein product [Spirodela intermedia]|uniref:Uncharacterized protein n=1 Tax=Spirodela intermedia TaxID=51605 RepID=A0A7I8I835_SPIIN|nr:unnamed protein product [Spirodela intermedia]CAA6653806.1 unnamed protein product [Spirodela intermedia]
MSGYSGRDARKLFDKMPLRDPVSYNVMIRDYIRDGNIEEARNMFDRMPGRNTVSWNSMIMGYSSRREMHAALKLFFIMPDHCKDAVSWTTVAGGLARGCRLGDSLKLLEQSPQPHPAAWASVVSGAQQNGLACEALVIFREMLSLGITPVSHAFTSAAAAAADLSALLLYRCSSGMQPLWLCRRRADIFDSMHRDFGIRPRPEHYACLIDVFARAGMIREAADMILDVPFEASSVVWRALLNGCRIYGQHAAAASLKAMEIYRASGRCAEEARLGQSMGRRVGKEVGCSWVEVQGRAHVFTTRDETHYESQSIYMVLKLTNEIAAHHE